MWIAVARGLAVIAIILGCLGVGGLIGFALAELASVNTILAVVVSMISCAAILVLFGVIRWFGPFELPGAMAVSGYAGAVGAGVIRISLILGRPLWLAAILAVVCVLLGLYVGVRSGEGHSL